MSRTPTKVSVPSAFRPVRAELAAIDEVSKLLTASRLDPDALLQEIVRTTAQEMGMKASVLRLFDEDTRELGIKAAHGLSDEFLHEQSVIETKKRFARLIENDGVIMIGDVRLDADFAWSDAAEKEGIRSLLAVGLYRDKVTVGALSVYSESPHEFTVSEVQALRVIANQASVALELTQLHEHQMEKEWLERELSLAAELQANFLPKTMPSVPGFDIQGSSLSWEEIGGDFFDFIQLPQDNLGIAVGDVSGKGIPAALLMFMVRTALRAHSEHEYGISEIISRVNTALHRDTESEQFATLFYGVLNAPARVLTYVNAGHNPPLLFRKGEIQTLRAGGAPVGLIGNSSYAQTAVALQRDDVLVIYTDGYSEITGLEEEGVEEELFVKVLDAHLDVEAKEIITSVERTLGKALDMAEHGDDRTMVVLKVR